MSASIHLPILRDMFPNKLYLEATDLAQVLNVSKQHIYNLSSAKKLPFPVVKDKTSDKLQVLLVLVAKYLDSLLPQEQPEKPSVPSLIKRGRGRPVGSKTKEANVRQMVFQHQLSMAIVHWELENTFTSLLEEVDGFSYQDNQQPCVDKFEELKGNALLSVRRAKSSLLTSMLEMQLPVQQKKPKVIDKLVKV